MKIFFTILILSTINFYSKAQEIYPWSKMQEVKFYNLSNENIEPSNFNISSLDSIKSISFKKNVWAKILPYHSKLPKDTSIEEGFFVITVKFKNGEIIPFQLFPKQKTLLDLRKNHFNFIDLATQVHPLLNKIFNKSIICYKDKNCNEVN